MEGGEVPPAPVGVYLLEAAEVKRERLPLDEVGWEGVEVFWGDSSGKSRKGAGRGGGDAVIKVGYKVPLVYCKSRKPGSQGGWN